MESRGGSSGGLIFSKDAKEKSVGGIMRIENPFTLKVGQVFTGFGIGCGLGIGVGRPLNLGAIPVLNQVMVATRGATDAFSGVQGHVNSALRKVGAKNIEAGIGCGVGFGHGFGVGLAVKPSVLRQIQSHVLQLATGVMQKLGIGSSSTLFANQVLLKESSHENPGGSSSELVKPVVTSPIEGNIINGKAKVSSDQALAPIGAAAEPHYTGRTEKVLDNFLKNLKEEGSVRQEQAERLQLENSVLQMVLKHQILIEELMKENEKLQQKLAEALKGQPTKLQSNFNSRSKSPCTECFECRRKQRRR